LLVVVAACGVGEPSPGGAIIVHDDADLRVELARPARRVVSLVPSGTDVVVALGAANRVVGRTDYDTAPEVAAVPSLGGGLDPSLEVLVALRPELVIAWAEAGPSALRGQLEPLGIAVYGLRTQDTAGVFRDIERLGRLVGCDSAALALAVRLRGELAAVRASVAGRPRPTVVYLVEHDPPLIAGRGTFISEIIGVAGGETAFPDVAALWPQISLEELVRRQPDVLVFPGLEGLEPVVERLRQAPGWRELRAVREGRVVRVPAELLGRPGPQLGAAARALRDLLHPGAAGGGA
jgi:iron complex transport system substrate-binding protein